MESMQTAELIFPGLDFLATATKDEQKGFKKKMERSKLFVDDYMGRRAQAKFVSTYIFLFEDSLIDSL